MAKKSRLMAKKPCCMAKKPWRMAFALVIIAFMAKKGAVEYRKTELELFRDEILADLDAVAAKVEKFERWQFEPQEFVRAYINVPKVFLTTMVSLVEHQSELAAMKKLDPAEGRETLEYADAFASVADRFEAIGKRLRRNMRSRLARLAAQAMQMYAIVKGLARYDRQMEMSASHLARDLGPRGRPRKARGGKAQSE
jgi:hypothetical protein